ncbi:MAG: hypothetical protein LBV51_02935 [Acholeplasmatales bacterium]|jgi:hypothetical protein|nr:hypothetical protein [Acholeplasmatales bacterium]
MKEIILGTALEKTQIVIIILLCVSVVILVTAIIIYILTKKNKKDRKVSKSSNVEIVNNTRYTDTKKDGVSNIKYTPGDNLLTLGVTYTISKEGPLLPGKYTIYTAVETQKRFNLRVNGIVREYNSETIIVLAENDTVNPVNCNIILR